jgi:UDP-N-acetylglucosamine--N-acetylmuramyl-(pentapeptide) pyrophosphoryl-undecaprenol N-acetylglucosamine transferase
MGPCVAVMAGGTGGHVFPALAVAEELRGRGATVFWIGTRRGMESRLVPEQGFEMEWLGIEGVRGKGLGQMLKAPFNLGAALWQAGAVLRRRRPSVVLGMGGFVSGPGGLAARILGLPLVVHEQNFVPGMTNQWLARVASRVLEAFPGSFPAGREAVSSGNPVRRTIADLPPPRERLMGRTGAPRLLVVGGSLGALALNETLPLAIKGLPREITPVIRHQAGERTLEVARAAYAAAGVEAEVTPFIRDMAEAYAWADLVVCRAGALTVSELAAAGLGAVLIPYPFAVDDHQVGNARFLADVGAAHILIQRDLTADGLRSLLAELLGDRAGLLSMAEKARLRAAPHATTLIADVCMELAGGPPRTHRAPTDPRAHGELG